MGRVNGPYLSSRWADAELSDPALAHLFGPGIAPLAVEPAAVAPPPALPASKWLAWALPTKVLEADETLLQLEDGGFFEIRDVPADDLDFEISVEEDPVDLGGLETRGVLNLDDFPAEFEADLATFEGITGCAKGGPVEPSRPACLRDLVGAAGLEPATPAV